MSTYKRSLVFIYLILNTTKDVDYIADAFETIKELSFPNIPELVLSLFFRVSPCFEYPDHFCFGYPLLAITLKVKRQKQ